MRHLNPSTQIRAVPTRHRTSKRQSPLLSRLGLNPSIQIRAVPTDRGIPLPELLPATSQSHLANQGNSDVNTPVRAYVQPSGSQSHHKTQGNPDDIHAEHGYGHCGSQSLHADQGSSDSKGRDPGSSHLAPEISI